VVVWDVEGKVVDEEEKVLDTWKAHYDKPSNEEFVWDKHSLSDVGWVSGSSVKISVADVQAAMAKMKNYIAAGLRGIVSEMLQVCAGLMQRLQTNFIQY